jgi:hypothetical protein
MDYYKDTPPLEFIGDVYDIMKDGDCLSPEKLNADVVDMLRKYLSAQQNMYWTAGIVRRFEHFLVVKFILSLWRSLASRQ